MNKKLCFLLLVLSFNFSHAKVFRNSYLSFELPNSWSCKLENTEWVCRSELDKESREAIIILTAKEAGPIDSLDNYISHLSTPQPTSYKGSGGGTSKIIYPPKRVNINDQVWIDGLHIASEVPNYYTRYLATIKDRIAVLFTCSTHKDYYTKYSQDFFGAVNSLKVIATKNILSTPESGIGPSGNELVGTGIGQTMGEVMASPDAGDSLGGGGKVKSLLLALALVLAAFGGYLFYKSKKK